MCMGRKGLRVSLTTHPGTVTYLSAVLMLTATTVLSVTCRRCVCHLGLPQALDLPGLNRTMARRHPSSDLSICMSFILDTSSVKTLHVGDMGGQMIRHRYRQQGWGLESIWDMHWERPQFFSAGRGSFEGPPHHTLLFYTCISSIRGSEHQIHSRSHFAQHMPSVLCSDCGEQFAFTWGKLHGFFSTFHCVKHGHCP